LVTINNRNENIFDWLKQKVEEKFFDLGVAESSEMTGAFLLFEQIGLKKYIATSAVSPFPVHLHFLGQKLYVSIPGKLSLKLTVV